MYSFSIFLFSLIVRIAAFFGHTKAKQLAEGQKQVWKQLQEKLKPNELRIWIHCASVGEFEQGRPLMEDIRSHYPQYKILVTFFSSSGYELRKNYTGADYVFYLPYDTRRNAHRFLQLVNPQKIYFIKYEFWRNYLKVIKKRQIPLYLVSAIFRSEQPFFKWYGGWYRKLLSAFTHFFVQNTLSKELLNGIGYNNVTVTGDTRFDRVCRIFDQAHLIPVVEQFVNGKQCVVAGSTWAPDEEILVRFINTKNHNIKWIIAPHEMHENQICRLIESIKVKTVRYSNFGSAQSSFGSALSSFDSALSPEDFQVLIIDNIGLLSSLYRYGTVAYIGGGFGKGIHNTLEAAVYGIPVLFGPAYKKFREAVDLIELGGAFAIKNWDEFAQHLNNLLNKPDKTSKAGTIAGNFVNMGRGATNEIVKATLVAIID